MTRIECLSKLANNLHYLHRETKEMTWEEDPYSVVPNGEIRYFREVETREEIIKYIKGRLSDTDFINKIFSDDFLDEDDSEVLRNKKIQELKKEHSFSDNIIEMLVELIDCGQGELSYLDSSDGESDNVDDLINDIETSDEYIVIFDDSDGERLWYKKVPTRDILNYVIKSEHRKCIGCGCNQYIHMIIKNKEDLNMDLY